MQDCSPFADLLGEAETGSKEPIRLVMVRKGSDLTGQRKRNLVDGRDGTT
jgi:hypothetical protein